MGFFQLLRALVAAHLNRIAADGDLDRIRISSQSQAAQVFSTMIILHEHPSPGAGNRPPGRERAIKIFSDLPEQALTMQRRLPELRGRAPVGLAEGGAEMAVAGEAEVQAQGGQVVILREEVERPRQP